MVLIEDEHSLRVKIISITEKMDSYGMNNGTSGNISARINGGMLITPSSIPYKDMGPNDLLEIDMKGNLMKTALHKSSMKPSSEWRLHAEILNQRQEINSIVHCHSINAAALSCHAKEIPSFHYMVAVAGGENIRCSKYATFGTIELSKNAIKALEGRLACLLAQHGQVAIGKNLDNALKVAIEVENLCNIYIKSCQLGEPKRLSSLEMTNILRKFKSLNYGQGL